MTKLEARREAKRRWGIMATVRVMTDGKMAVGVRRPAHGAYGVPVLEILGKGDSWEEAFNAADA